jgi:hypothetical protein
MLHIHAVQPSVYPSCLCGCSLGSLPRLGDSLLSTLSGPSSVTSELDVSCVLLESFLQYSIIPRPEFLSSFISLSKSCSPSSYPYKETRLTLGSTPVLSAHTLNHAQNRLTVQVLVPLCLGLCDTISVSLLVLVVAIDISINPIDPITLCSTHLVWFFDLAILDNLALLDGQQLLLVSIQRQREEEAEFRRKVITP